MYQNGKNISFTDRSNSSVAMFLHDIRKSEPLSITEEYSLWQLMRNGSISARNKLIYANLRYVVTIAKKYLPSGAAFEDLLMAGSLGITKAAEMFDASLGNRFISYATWYIESEIQKVAYDHLKHTSSTVSLDEPIDADDSDSDTLMSRLPSLSNTSADWNVRYADTLDAIKKNMDTRFWVGSGEMLNDYLAMMQSGYTTSDFARKHNLSDRQMKRFLDMLYSCSHQILGAAA